MAKCVSHIHSSIRGSIAGITYLTTPSGSIIARQRVKPVNPATSYQNDARSAFSYASARWLLTGDSNREKWRDHALATHRYTSSTGMKDFIAAESLWNRLRFGYGMESELGTCEVPVDFAGYPLCLVEPVPYEGAPQSTGCSIKVMNYNGVDGVFMIKRSIGYKVTRNYHKGPYDPSTTQILTITAMSSETADFTGLVEGNKYFFEVNGVAFQGDAGAPTGIVAYERYRTAAVAETAEGLP